jgi:hypothetical protein
MEQASTIASWSGGYRSKTSSTILSFGVSLYVESLLLSLFDVGELSGRGGMRVPMGRFVLLFVFGAASSEEEVGAASFGDDEIVVDDSSLLFKRFQMKSTIFFFNLRLEASPRGIKMLLSVM